MKMNEPLFIAAAKPRAKTRPRTGPVTVYLRDLAVQTVIGVAAWERKAPRTLMFDIDIELGDCKAGGTDRVADTVDYAAVAASVRAKLGSETYRLLERAVEDVADILFDEFGADAVAIQAAKTGVVPETGSVGVRIERLRPDARSGT
jgi:7,8-dihydroneopterin aldolase/epimerase/oxygenase